MSLPVTYVLPLKDNQGRLHETIKSFFDQGLQNGFGDWPVDTHKHGMSIMAESKPGVTGLTARFKV